MTLKTTLNSKNGSCRVFIGPSLCSGKRQPASSFFIYYKSWIHAFAGRTAYIYDNTNYLYWYRINIPIRQDRILIFMTHLISPLLLVVVFLFGCATPSIQKTTQIPENWTLKAKQLAQIQNWHLTATLGIKTENKGGSFRVDWLQNKQNYEILCLGSFGQLIGKLTGTPQFASLILNTGEQRTGDPAILAKEILGVSIPFQELLFWIRGVPAPALSSQLFFNDKDEVAEIIQAGWKISYSAWTSGSYPLPEKITLEKPPIRVKMVISSWDVNSNDLPNL